MERPAVNRPADESAGQSISRNGRCYVKSPCLPHSAPTGKRQNLCKCLRAGESAGRAWVLLAGVRRQNRRVGRLDVLRITRRVD